PKETTVLVPPIPSFNVNGLTAHLTRLALSGQDVEISFTTDSQGTPLYYQYWLASGYQTQHYGNWQMLKDWSPDNTLMWAPESDDHYVVVAYVTDDPSSNSFHQAGLCIETAENSANPIRITGLTSNIRYPQNRGVPITLNTTAIGGGSPLFYKYLYCKGIGGIWQIISDYSTESSCTWTPTEDGLYTVVVWVTDDTSVSEPSIAGMTCTIGD
ncbi:MAG: triple tyrosine motif-containing protein, partial [Pseudomonadota bacterium]